jgi:hypothetical protein
LIEYSQVPFSPLATWLRLSLNALLGEVAPHGATSLKKFSKGYKKISIHLICEKGKTIWKKKKPWIFGLKKEDSKPKYCIFFP